MTHRKLEWSLTDPYNQKMLDTDKLSSQQQFGHP